MQKHVISYLLIWYFNTKCRGFIIKPHENAKLSVRKTTISIRQTAAVPIISRLTQGIHYQVHLCRCKTAAALCVTNGGETAGTHDKGSNTSGGNSSGDGDTSGGNMSDGGGSTDDSNYVEL